MMARWRLYAQLAMPDTVLGWMELIGMLFFPIVSAVGIYFFLKHGQADNQRDINGLGERVKELELGAERRNTRLNTVESLLANQDKDIRDSQGDIQRMNTMIENFRTEQHEMKLEIIAFISKRTDEIGRAVHKLDVDVAVLSEQVKDSKRRDDR